MKGSAHPVLLRPGTEVGGYTLEDMLGSGGFGAVYRARQGVSTHALKLLYLEHVGGWAEREVAILLRLKHPGVVGFRGCGYWPAESPRFLYVAMEYVDGLRLDEWARRMRRGPLEIAGKVLDVARALAAVHEARVVHRDVKEANILVRHEDGRAVLVDFGAGCYEGAPGLTSRALPPGTAEYRAPEAWRFMRRHAGDTKARYAPGPRDDLYALGVVLYRLLTGTSPHVPPRNWLEAVLPRAPRPPHVLNPRVTRALSRVCLRLLAARPRDRYADAREVCAALKAAGAESAVGENEVRAPQPAAPARPSLLRRGARWLTVGVLCAATVAVLCALAAPRAVRGSTRAEPTAAMTPVPVGEVAAPGQAPEADRAAAPLREEPIPAATAVAVSIEDTASVKTKKTPAPSPAARQPRATLAKTALTVACMQAGTACTSAQVRPPPGPEECPPGAVEAMKSLGIEEEAEHIVSLLFSNDRRPVGPIPIREGTAVLRVMGDWKQMPQNTVLSDRFIVGEERVYGRFTEATTPGGKRIPVCLEVGDLNGGNGVHREPDDGSGAIRVFSSMMVVAVPRFQ